VLRALVFFLQVITLFIVLACHLFQHALNASELWARFLWSLVQWKRAITFCIVVPLGTAGLALSPQVTEVVVTSVDVTWWWYSHCGVQWPCPFNTWQLQAEYYNKVYRLCK